MKTEAILAIQDAENSEDENSEDPFRKLISDSPFETYQEVHNIGNIEMRDQTTVFMNKYCEDPNLPSVANKLADMIVDFEIASKIPIEDDSDFEIDDEIVSEEQFLEIKSKEGIRTMSSQPDTISLTMYYLPIGQHSKHIYQLHSPATTILNVLMGYHKNHCTSSEVYCVQVNKYN